MDNRQLAQGIASLGRYGDSMLMHVRPDEVAQLQAISRANGGDITINPETGQPEAFIGAFLPMLAGLGVSAALPAGAGMFAQYGLPAIAGAAAKGITTGDASLGNLLSGAMGGIGGAGIGSDLIGFGAEGAAAAVPETTGEIATEIAKSGTGNLPAGATTATMNSVPQAMGTEGISMFTPAGQQFGNAGQTLSQAPGIGGPLEYQSVANTYGVTQAPQPFFDAANTSIPQASAMYNEQLSPYGRIRVGQTGSSAQNLQMAPKFDTPAGGFEPPPKVSAFEQGLNQGKAIAGDTFDTMGKNFSTMGKGFEKALDDPMGYFSYAGGGDSPMFGAAKTLSTPLMATVEAMTPKVQPFELDKRAYYDSSRTLNLNDDTGLRLVAKGGHIKGYKKAGTVSAEPGSVSPPTSGFGGGLTRLLTQKGNVSAVDGSGNPINMSNKSIVDMLRQQGIIRYADGGIAVLTPDNGKMLNGQGDGVSDDIPANIEGEQEAALSDGEFIVPARIVSELGNGSSDAGAEKLYAMIDRIQGVREQTMGDNKQYAKDTNAERFLPV